MIIVRNCFVAKPGCAGKLAAQLKDATTTAQLPGCRILTDLTGDFNRVIMEYEAESISGFEESMKRYMTDGVMREKLKGYTDHWVTGSREIFQVV